MKELDEVVIPFIIAEKAGVVRSGTIVWYVPDAVYATVECAILADNPEGIKTRLIDVSISKLQPR